MKTYSLSDLNRRPGELVDLALIRPIMLTKHKRPQLVMMSAAHYDQLVSGRAESEFPSTLPSPAAPKSRGLSGLRTQSTIDGDEDDRY